MTCLSHLAGFVAMISPGDGGVFAELIRTVTSRYSLKGCTKHDSRSSRSLKWTPRKERKNAVASPDKRTRTMGGGGGPRVDVQRPQETSVRSTKLRARLAPVGALPVDLC